jgi:hypothetical protein
MYMFVTSSRVGKVTNLRQLQTGSRNAGPLSAKNGRGRKQSQDSLPKGSLLQRTTGNAVLDK